MAPLVGVTMSRGLRQSASSAVEINFLSQPYVHALATSGVTPILIPSALTADALRAIYERVDGIVLSGGGDVHPQYLQVDPQAAALCTEIDEERDQTELTLTRWAMADDKPLFGICRGQQVMNVALGGSLITDIPSQIGKQVTHAIENAPDRRFKLLHSVEVFAKTRLGRILGAGRVEVNSIHHQAVSSLGAGLIATATAPDGLIEALEAPDARFFLGVQWHPEEIFDRHPQMPLLFSAFAETMR